MIGWIMETGLRTGCVIRVCNISQWLMEYVCFKQLDVTASNINSEYCLLHVHIYHSYSCTDRLFPLSVHWQQVSHGSLVKSQNYAMEMVEALQYL